MATSSRRYPSRQGQLIPWARARATLWLGGQSGPPDIGISAPQSVEFDEAVTAVEAAVAAESAAKAALKTAGQNKRTAYKTMVKLLGSLMRTIDAYAVNTADPGVWSRAAIPQPRSGGERPAPPQPTALSAQLVENGSVLFGWEVTSGGGAMYEVRRQVQPLDAAPGPWQTIAFIGEKRFIDEAVPVGVAAVNYQVRVRISTGASPWSVTSTASFGSAGAMGGPLTRVA